MPEAVVSLIAQDLFGDDALQEDNIHEAEKVWEESREYGSRVFGDDDE